MKEKKTSAYFTCEIALELSDEDNIKNLSISTNNENIGGCLSPYLTDENIEEK